jgi:hypothetical protein
VRNGAREGENKQKERGSGDNNVLKLFFSFEGKIVTKRK